MVLLPCLREKETRFSDWTVPSNPDLEETVLFLSDHWYKSYGYWKNPRSLWSLGCLGIVTVVLHLVDLPPRGFPGGSDGKESACSAGDMASIPRLGRSPGEGNGYPLQYSCLENSMPGEFHRLRSLLGCSPWGHKELDMTEPLTLSLSR